MVLFREMGQEKVIKVLGRHKNWLSTKEVAAKTKIMPEIAARCLRVMFKYGEVSRKKSPDGRSYLWLKK